MNEHGEGWRAHAPGSLMWMGEHAVLHGKRALVCAVDKTLRVTVLPRADRTLRIQSALGDDVAELGQISVRDPFRFIWSILASYGEALPAGADILVDSDFSDKVGFGSSAAVTAALLAALDAWCGRRFDRLALHQRTVEIIRAVQGAGSGADAAASIYGGVVLYRAIPLEIESVPVTFPLSIVFSGYKTPTADVIAKVDAERERRPALYDGLFYEIDECVADAVDALCRDDWNAVGQCMNENHTLMDALGVNDETLETIVQGLRAQPDVLGAKISGSGLGDCVIGLGSIAKWDLPYTVLSAGISREGVRVEKI